ncbi:hypothetical protein EIP91_006825 [Steccherinum ochraceum]|uniref:Uncharacterized protein n=1 Tax=Steccherinum ochraceum TaxID=92696 RepID=A0A4V6N724_9APHY|nr:hypothetical protein EIP91_006825 [Steccherinum ochraceum]
MPGLSVLEIIEMVVDFLRGDKSTLSACATVSKLWLTRARYHLFRTVQIVIRDPQWNLESASNFFSTTPSICSPVQHIHIRAARVMKLPMIGMDDMVGVWPVPQNGADLRQICRLLQSFPNALSMDLEGVYMELSPKMLAVHMNTLVSPSLRKLTVREVLMPSAAFACVFNLTNIFTELDDLSLVNLLFDTAGVVAGLDRPPPWGGDFKVSSLLLRHVSGLLSLLPHTAFRNVRQLDIPMLSLLIPDAARFLIPLYDTLEQLTLAVGQFGLNDIAKNSFELTLCSRLHTLTFIQTGKAVEPALAILFLANVNACLRLAPSHLHNDGVLIRGKHGLPGAKKALTMLDGNNKFGLKIPYILLTNGGGVSEEAKAADLTSIIGHEIDPSRVILAHTVLKAAASKFADDPILVLGGKNDEVRKVAESYGFKQVYTSLDVLAWNPSAWPFVSLNEEERRTAKPADFSQISLRAALVFHDPRHWSLDIQLLCDMILSDGIIGGPCVNPSGEQAEDGIELVFCNPDLLWKSDFPQTRLGQGAFREAFQSVFMNLTGATYPYLQLGKPTKPTYDYAKRILLDQLSRDTPEVSQPTPQVYMVGDNPESDIAGANHAGWKSLLVRTGVYDPARGPPTHSPTHEVEDVEEAVALAIDMEAGSVSVNQNC